MSEEQAVLVDEHDNVIGSKPKNDLSINDTTRSVMLRIEKPSGEHLIAIRSHKKPGTGGMLTLPVLGGVKFGEEYHDAMIREIREEIGLSVEPSQLIKDMYLRMQATSGKFYSFVQGYQLQLESYKSLTPDPDEIESFKWFSTPELIDLYSEQGDNMMNGVKIWIQKELLK